MSTGSALLLVAVIVSAENGAARIDQGSSHGLEPGDQGQVFYALIVDGRAQRIDAGSARVLDTNESTASVQAAPGTELRPGYEIEFKLPTSRTKAPPADLGEGPAPSLDPDADIAPAPSPVDLPPPLPIVTAETAPTIEAAGPVPAGVRSPEPDAISAPAPSPPTRTTVLIPAGSYSIGRDLLTAEFHNQTPRFEFETRAITIDRRPVTVEQYLAAGNSPIGEQIPTDPVRAVTWLEAESYCHSVGGRLPSELEWEIAVQLPDVESPSGLLEWTESWYSPYPGNVRQEEQYGTTYRVLRGGPSGATFDPHARRFMAPDQRNSSVGFRCASADG